MSAWMNVVRCPEGQRPKATEVSPWYGVYRLGEEFYYEFERKSFRDFGRKDRNINPWIADFSLL